LTALAHSLYSFSGFRVLKVPPTSNPHLFTPSVKNSWLAGLSQILLTQGVDSWQFETEKILLCLEKVYINKANKLFS